MKKFVILFVFLLLSLSVLQAQSFKGYIAVHYNSVQRTAMVNVGDEMIVLKDSKGEPIKFNTLVAVFNYLGKRGWTIVPIDMQNSNTQSGDMYLFTKTVSSERALKSEFEKK